MQKPRPIPSPIPRTLEPAIRNLLTIKIKPKPMLIKTLTIPIQPNCKDILANHIRMHRSLMGNIRINIRRHMAHIRRSRDTRRILLPMAATLTLDMDTLRLILRVLRPLIHRRLLMGTAHRLPTNTRTATTQPLLSSTHPGTMDTAVLLLRTLLLLLQRLPRLPQRLIRSST